MTHREQLNDAQLGRIETACAGARALCSLSESTANKEAMRKAGLVPLMSRLLKSVHIDLVTSIMGTCHHCSSEVRKIKCSENELPFLRVSFQSNFQLAIVTECMIPDIVYHLYADHLEIKLESASAIFKCADNKRASEMVRESHGLEQLVAIIKDKSMRENKKLLAAATGAIWKCAVSSAENVRQLDNVCLVSLHLSSSFQ